MSDSNIKVDLTQTDRAEVGTLIVGGSQRMQNTPLQLQPLPEDPTQSEIVAAIRELQDLQRANGTAQALAEPES